MQTHTHKHTHAHKTHTTCRTLRTSSPSLMEHMLRSEPSSGKLQLCSARSTYVCIQTRQKNVKKKKPEAALQGELIALRASLKKTLVTFSFPAKVRGELIALGFQGAAWLIESLFLWASSPTRRCTTSTIQLPPTVVPRPCSCPRDPHMACKLACRQSSSQARRASTNAQRAQGEGEAGEAGDAPGPGCRTGDSAWQIGRAAATWPHLPPSARHRLQASSSELPPTTTLDGPFPRCARCCPACSLGRTCGRARPKAPRNASMDIAGECACAKCQVDRGALEGARLECTPPTLPQARETSDINKSTFERVVGLNEALQPGVELVVGRVVRLTEFIKVLSTPQRRKQDSHLRPHAWRHARACGRASVQCAGRL